MTEQAAAQRARIVFGPGGHAARWVAGRTCGAEVGVWKGGTFYQVGVGRTFEAAFTDAADRATKTAHEVDVGCAISARSIS
jgi:hypothetical protein